MDLYFSRLDCFLFLVGKKMFADSRFNFVGDGGTGNGSCNGGGESK